MENVEKVTNQSYAKALRNMQPVENLWKRSGSFPQAVEKKKFLHISLKLSTMFYQSFPQKKRSYPQAKI